MQNETEIQTLNRLTSNLLLLWQDIAKLEVFISGKDPITFAVFGSPELVNIFLRIDRDKLEQSVSEIEADINKFKITNAFLFFNLQSRFQPIQSKITTLIIPYLHDKEVAIEGKIQMMLSLINVLLSDVEALTLEITNILGAPQTEQAKAIFEAHQTKLAFEYDEEIDFGYNFDLPEHILDFLNHNFFHYRSVTHEEVRRFTRQPTMLAFLIRLNTIDFWKVVLSYSDYQNTKLIGDSLYMNYHEYFPELWEQIVRSKVFDKWSDEFWSYLPDTFDFYRCKLILDALKRYRQPVPYQWKRTLVKVYTGQIDFKKLWEAEKIRLNVE